MVRFLYFLAKKALIHEHRNAINQDFHPEEKNAFFITTLLKSLLSYSEIIPIRTLLNSLHHL